MNPIGEMRHELLWTKPTTTTSDFPADEDQRSYCFCGWVSDAGNTNKDMRLSFIKHLERLNEAVSTKVKIRGKHEQDRRVI